MATKQSENHKENVKKYSSSDKGKETMREYRERNEEKIREYYKNYKVEHADKIKEYAKKAYIIHRSDKPYNYSKPVDSLGRRYVQK